MGVLLTLAAYPGLSAHQPESYNLICGYDRLIPNLKNLVLPSPIHLQCKCVSIVWCGVCFYFLNQTQLKLVNQKMYCFYCNHDSEILSSTVLPFQKTFIWFHVQHFHMFSL